MPLSLKCKLSKLRHNGQITDDEYNELIKKLDGHDKQILLEGARNFAEWLYAKANVPIYDYYGRKTKTDDLLAEWQKGEL